MIGPALDQCAPDKHIALPLKPFQTLKCLAYELTVRVLRTGFRIRYMLLNLLAFADRRPSNTNNTFEQHSELAYNQDNGSIHLQRNRSERQRLQGLQRMLTNVSSNMAPRTQDIQRKVQRLAHKRRWPPEFIRFMDIPPSASRRFRLRTQ
jgi:hypothetical protein